MSIESQPFMTALDTSYHGSMSSPKKRAELSTPNDDEKSVFQSVASLLCKDRICLIPKEWIFAPEDGKKVSIQNSFVDTVVLLLNSMIGSGIFVQAYVFFKAGILSALVEYAIIASLIFFGVEVLIKCSEREKIFSYHGLCSFALGPWGKPILEASIIVNNAGALISYVIIIGSLFHSVVETFVEDTSVWYLNASFLTFVVMSCITVPVCLIRNYGHLAAVSYLSVIAIAGTVLLVLFTGTMTRPANRDHSAINWGSFNGSLETLGSVVFGFGFASSVFHAYAGMHIQQDQHMIQQGPNNEATLVKVAMTTVLCGLCLNLPLGLAGYLTFRDDTDANILENFSGVVGAVFKLVVIIHLIFFIPGDYLILRASMFNLFNEDASLTSDRTHIAVTLFTFGLVTVTACLLLAFESTNTSLSLVLDLTGGIAGAMTNFILPGAIAMGCGKDRSNEIYYKGLGLVGFGSCIPILVIYNAISRYAQSS